MMRRSLAVAALAALVPLTACLGGSSTPGEMSAQTYRSLEARADLTPAYAKDQGAADDDALAQKFLDEGGAAAPSGAECLYAETTYRGSYRGVARFCFEGEKVVSVERNRADLD